MRTFQFSDARSHKFWQIEVSGKSFTVTYGKVGTVGQTQTKTFPTPQKAQDEADKLINEKLKKGYTETTPRAGISTGEALEAAIRANPDDRAAHAAYADYLTEQGDPRGEFIQVQLALEDESAPAAERKKLQAREKELLKKHETEWVGDWPALYPAPIETEGRGQVNHTGGRRYEFKRGLLTTAHFGQLTVAAARAFVKAPQTRFVRELFVGDCDIEEEYEPGPDIPEGTDPETGAPALHVLLRWPFMRNVRRFQFGWTADEDYGDFCHFQCHQSGDRVYDFIKQMPDVEEVYVFAHLGGAEKLVALPMPRLRVLQLYHGFSYPLERLAKNKTLTHLTHLLCHPHAIEGGSSPYIQMPELRAVCRSPHLTSLTHLRLRLTDFGDEGAKEIIASGLLKRLKVLDLRHGAITDEGAERLADCPDLKNLTRLDLSRNGLTAAGKRLLKETGVSADLSFQHLEVGDQDAYGDLPRYLFEGDYE